MHSVSTCRRRWLASCTLLLGLVAGTLAGCSAQPQTLTPSGETQAQTQPQPLPDPPVTPEPVAPTAELTVALDPPKVTIDCGKDFIGDCDWLDTVIGYSVHAYPPYRIRIDYGDGRSYENNDEHLAAVFTHRYTTPGTFTVVASVTDVNGATAEGTCVNSWIPTPATATTPTTPIYPFTPISPGGGYTVTCSDGWSSSSGGKQGACSSHGGVG